MNSALERLVSLRVADVMTKTVVGIPANDTMAEAAAKLSEFKISGAPVVDEQGHCVGVVSAADFVRRARPDHGRFDGQDDVNGGAHALVHHRLDEPFHIEEIQEDRVSRHMSPSVQSLSADASLLQAARAMCGMHIHRIPVLDRRGRPLGVVSSLDIVAALVNAFEE